MSEEPQEKPTLGAFGAWIIRVTTLPLSGASDRVDIVRGPASPIYGPAKIGGYLNFNPKSARIEETGAYIAENTGALSYTTGSWDKSILTAEIGGPGEIGGKPMGFYLYGELENSGSFTKMPLELSSH